MKPKDITVEILKQIRDEARKTNERLDKTNERLDKTNERLDHVETSLGARLDRMERRQTESDLRLSSELVAVVQAVDKVRDLLADRLDLSKKVDDHEKRLAVIEGRLGN
jgi:hypothetical protein